MKAGVIFDMDGVLIDSEKLQYKAYSEVLASFGVSVGREEYAREWIAAGHGTEYAVVTYKLPLRPEELRARKDPVYHRILQAEVELMPGAVAALSRLGAVFPLALATNSNAMDVSFVLRRFDLKGFFRAIVCREQYERPKPEPDAFVAAAAALELPPRRCVVVEDAYKGVLAAARAGTPCVAVPHAFTRNNDFHLARRVVGSLDEVTADLVRELAGTN